MIGDEAPMTDSAAREVIESQARRIAGDVSGMDVDLLSSEIVLPDGRSWLVAAFDSHLVVAHRGLSLPQLAALMTLGEDGDLGAGD